MVKGEHVVDLGKSGLWEHRQTAERELSAMAKALGGDTFMFVVIGNHGHSMASVSSDLKPYERGFVAEVDRARTNRISVCHPGAPNSLRRAEEALARTKHTELHPIVAVLIESLNRMNGVRVSRSTALKDVTALPTWWPHTSKKYAERMQQLTIKDLTVVIDAIIREVRGDVTRVEKLWEMLTAHFKIGSCSLGTRAVFDAYFDFLLTEATNGGYGEGANGNGVYDAYALGNGADDGSENGHSRSSDGKDSFALDLNVESVPGQLPMSNGVGNGAGNLLGGVTSGFQAVAPRNVHRPQPRKPVPNFTKQVQSTVDDVPRVTGVRDHVALMAAGSQRAANTAEILSRSLFTPQEYAETDRARKRARKEATFADLAWSRGTDNSGGDPPVVSFVSSLVAPPSFPSNSVPALLKKYDALEGASHEEWRKLFREHGMRSIVGAQSAAHNDFCAPSTAHTGPARDPSAANNPSDANPESPNGIEPSSFPRTERAESTDDAAVDAITGNLQRLPETDQKSGARDPRYWRTGNMRIHVEGLVDETEEAGGRRLEAAPADARLAAAPLDSRLPEASDVIAALILSPSPSESVTSASRQRDDLAFVVASLVRGLIRISSSEGLTALNEVPEWFPFPEHYPNFAETLANEDLLSILDVVFQKVRGEYFHIRELRGKWDASRCDVSNPVIRAAINGYFDALEAEAAARLPKSASRMAFQGGRKDEPMGGTDLQL